jgi:hypothetical protein
MDSGGQTSIYPSFFSSYITKEKHNMKRIIGLLVVLVVCFAVIMPVSANGPGDGNGGGNNGDTSGAGNGSGGVGGSENGGSQDPNGNTNMNGFGATYMYKHNLAQQGPRGTFALSGIISAIGENTVSIDVFSGSKLVHPLIGSVLTLSVTAQTRYLLREELVTTVIGLEDLQVGQVVSANGTVADNIWTASRITVGALLIGVQ